ncbi:MAG: TetR/AcrR family transcriptional regulator [Acidimicrobiia bacterium]
MPKVSGGSLAAHRREMRRRIFDALVSLVYGRGYDSVTLADVAAEAGLARTAIYNYFGDKETLLVEFVRHETSTYLARLQAALAEVEDPVEQLTTYVRMQLEYFESNHLPPGPALQYLMGEDAYRAVLDHVGDLEALLRSVVEAGVEAGAFAVDDLDAAMPLVVACLARPRPPDAPVDEVVATTMEFVTRALGAR